MNTPIITLEDRVCLITGAAGGQGRAHARLFSDLGAKLVLTDVDESGAQAIAAECEGAVGLGHDVASPADWARVVDTAVERFARVDVLVNNAGISPTVAFEDTSEGLIRQVMDINLIGPLLGMQAVVPAMRERRGSIVNISSTAGLAGYPERVP